MKNTIPLIVASVIAAIAVSLVWFRLGRVEERIQQTTLVWVARPDVTINVGDMITEANAERVERVKASLPRQAFSGSATPLYKYATRKVLSRDYILFDGVSDDTSKQLEPREKANCLTTVTFSDATVGRLIKAGTYITIVGLETSVKISQALQQPRDLNAESSAPDVVRETVYTLRPVLSNVCVQQVINGGAGVLLELSHRDAQKMLWAQRTMELYPWIVKNGATWEPETVTAEELEARLRELK